MVEKYGARVILNDSSVSDIERVLPPCCWSRGYINLNKQFTWWVVLITEGKKLLGQMCRGIVKCTHPKVPLNNLVIRIWPKFVVFFFFSNSFSASASEQIGVFSSILYARAHIEGLNLSQNLGLPYYKNMCQFLSLPGDKIGGRKECRAQWSCSRQSVTSSLVGKSLLWLLSCHLNVKMIFL